MSQKFVSKYPQKEGRPNPELTVSQVVTQYLTHKFHGEQIVAIQRVLIHMASIMQDGQQVRLAELLHHVPVATPFPPTCICCEGQWEPYCKVHSAV